MFKGIKRFKLVLVMVAFMTLFTGCFGSMVLTKKMYNWNDGIQNKFGKSVVFWATVFWVYPILGFVDWVFLNTIEFWTGSNPLAMSDTDREVQIVTNEKNEKFEITATQNRFDVKQLEGEYEGVVQTYVYNTDESAWYKQEGEKLTKISQKEDDVVSFFSPDGKVYQKEVSTVNN